MFFKQNLIIKYLYSQSEQGATNQVLLTLIATLLTWQHQHDFKLNERFIIYNLNPLKTGSHSLDLDESQEKLISLKA